jgi:molybdopterin/thiamine biosynthesis adenylyltransferase
MGIFMNKRYVRNYCVEGFDFAGQEILNTSTVIIFGVGGLGSFVSFHLTAMGLKNIILVDDDKVSISNLQRQILYTEESIDKDKVVEAKKTLSKLNSEINITIENTKDIEKILNKYKVDLIFDCTDNYKSRKLINQIAKEKETAVCSAAISGWEGWISIFKGEEDFSFENVFQEKAQYDSCDSVGVLSPAVGVVASMQTMEGIKFLLDLDYLDKEIILFNAYKNETKLIDWS